MRIKFLGRFCREQKIFTLNPNMTIIVSFALIIRCNIVPSSDQLRSLIIFYRNLTSKVSASTGENIMFVCVIIIIISLIKPLCRQTELHCIMFLRNPISRIFATTKGT
jgi:hypothetical protein